MNYMLKESSKEKEESLSGRNILIRVPNYVLLIDGHDKLKPFGFLVHGCSEGF